MSVESLKSEGGARAATSSYGQGRQFIINASFVHMRRQTEEDLSKIQEELEIIMSNLQRDPTRMTQFRGWSSRNAERVKEARERCFHWSAPGTPQLPRLQYADKL